MQRTNSYNLDELQRLAHLPEPPYVPPYLISPKKATEAYLHKNPTVCDQLTEVMKLPLEVRSSQPTPDFSVHIPAGGFIHDLPLLEVRVDTKVSIVAFRVGQKAIVSFGADYVTDLSRSHRQEDWDAMLPGVVLARVMLGGGSSCIYPHNIYTMDRHIALLKDILYDQD